MALTWSSALRELVCREVFNRAYADLRSEEAAHLDAANTPTVPTTSPGGVAGHALTYVRQFSQWFEEAGASSGPDAWEHVLAAEVGFRMCVAFKSERTDLAGKLRAMAGMQQRAWDAALNTYSLADASSTTLNDLTTTPKVCRLHVMRSLVRRRPRLFYPIPSIDMTMKRIWQQLWNQCGFEFRTRQASMEINQLTLADATWTEATKTLTKTAGFTGYTHVDGSRIVISDGTSAIVGEYLIASKTSNDAIVLGTSLSSTAGNLTTGDIDGSLCWVTFRNLTETFDSIVAPRLWYTDVATADPAFIEWVDGDTMARMKGRNHGETGRPKYFSIEDRGGAIRLWHFSPEPDDDYTLRGEVYVCTPSDPANASATTLQAAFTSEIVARLPRLTLLGVLDEAPGIPMSEKMDARNTLMREIEDLIPRYTRLNDPAPMAAMDVYGDMQRPSPFTGWSQGL